MAKNITAGRLVVVTGPMFSGKTSRLIELLEREMYAGRKTVLFKPEIDKRYDESSVTTHKGMKLAANVVPIDRAGVMKIEQMARAADVIGVDEVEFWNEDSGMVEMLEGLASKNKIVYASILNKSHLGRPFGKNTDVLLWADEVNSLTAVCAKCGEDATFTQRVIDGKEAFGPLILVGGKESYEPRCRRCFVAPEA